MSRSTIGFSGLLLILVSAYVTYGLVGQNQPTQFQGRGTVNVDSIGVEVYSDSGLTLVLHELNWGTLEPGQSRSVDVWVKNAGTISVSLSMWTDSWVPSAAESQISVNWDYNGAVLAAGSAVRVGFTLSVSPSIVGVTDFSHNIWVAGS